MRSMSRALCGAAMAFASAPAFAEKLTLAMPGVPPVFGSVVTYVAKEEGFFKKHGVNVKYTVIEDPVQRFNALKAGKLNAIATTVDTFSRTNAEGIASTMVLGGIEFFRDVQFLGPQI